MVDRYDLEARHAPAAIAVLPLVLLASVLVPEFQSSIALPTAFAIAMIAGVYGLLARVARERGRDRERELYAAWGGKPTTAMLRHRDGRINQHTKERYHARLRMLGPSFAIPSAAEEAADPAAADQRYESAVDELRRRAKAAKVASVHRENISFGFARNLIGLKPAGLIIALACLVVLGVSIWLGDGGLKGARTVEIALGGVLLVDIIAWVCLVRPNFVRHQAEAYATALFETAETISPKGRK